MKIQKKYLYFGLASAIGCFAIFTIQSSERPILDRLDSYEILDAVVDKNTNRTIELGLLSNFGSVEYEVGIYPSVNLNRQSSDLQIPIFSTVVHANPPEKIEFDGKCYYVRAEYRVGWTKILGKWEDPVTHNSICFYLLTPSRIQITNIP
jgi:hypothetical protein